MPAGEAGAPVASDLQAIAGLAGVSPPPETERGSELASWAARSQRRERMDADEARLASRVEEALADAPEIVLERAARRRGE